MVTVKMRRWSEARRNRHFPTRDRPRPCPGGEIGRRSRFRSCRRKVWGFDSLPGQKITIQSDRWNPESWSGWLFFVFPFMQRQFGSSFPGNRQEHDAGPELTQAESASRDPASAKSCVHAPISRCNLRIADWAAMCSPALNATARRSSRCIQKSST